MQDSSSISSAGISTKSSIGYTPAKEHWLVTGELCNLTKQRSYGIAVKSLPHSCIYFANHNSNNTHNNDISEKSYKWEIISEPVVAMLLRLACEFGTNFN
jgi:hypothetical protein